MNADIRHAVPFGTQPKIFLSAIQILQGCFDIALDIFLCKKGDTAVDNADNGDGSCLAWRIGNGIRRQMLSILQECGFFNAEICRKPFQLIYAGIGFAVYPITEGGIFYIQCLAKYSSCFLIFFHVIADIFCQNGFAVIHKITVPSLLYG